MTPNKHQFNVRSKPRNAIGILLLLPALSLSLSAATDKMRLIWQENPESEAQIIWNQVSGTNPTVYYDKLDHGQDTSSYANSQSPDKQLTYKEMDNRFTILSGLEPDTDYFFVIQDSDSISQRYYFHTAPNTPQPFRFIQGGDSRNNRDVRIDGNQLVAKLRPLFVSFGGDMINSGSSSEWQDWLDDWQYTTASDGRIFPIVPIRGNHESSNHIPNLFGVFNSDAYYKINVGGDLFCQYLLNSEIDMEGSQKNWLQTELETDSAKFTFLSASYHKPMRPHVSSKSEGDDVYAAFSAIFWNFRFDILAENDSHCVKRTIQVKPSNDAGSDQGFIADDEGFVMIGEGTWGAPTRAADDNKSWTLDSGEFNSFDLVDVFTDKIEVRTIKIDDESSTSALTVLDGAHALPAGLGIWQANGGAVQTVTPKNRSGQNNSTTVTLLSSGSEWSYYDGINAPAADWMQPSFDVSNWGLSAAELGYGDGDEASLLSYGADSSNKTVSYYFNNEFTIDNLVAAQTLDLNLVYDDGAVIYVNGQEVDRVNMPSGTVDHNTLASSTVINNASTSISIPLSMLVEGANTIAIEIHNRSLTSSDISFDANLSLTFDNSITVANPDILTLANYGDSWSYNDNGQAAQNDWTASGFDSTAWLVGNGHLGYGDNDETTLLTPHLSTYYFRKEVSIENLNHADYLLINAIYDDGFVIYINGVEIERVNMPDGAVSYDTNASSYIVNNAKANLKIAASALVEGVNIIAVEMHNWSTSSSDISFDAEIFHASHGLEPITQPIELFPLGSSWSYYDGENAPSNNWAEEAFNDDAWSTGSGHFGYGDGDEDTLLSYGSDPYSKTPTYYFRKQFDLTSAESLCDLEFDMTFDDGAILYINGQEFSRINMADGPTTHNSYTNAIVRNNAQAQFIIPANLLNSGSNTLAVEVHNRSGDSSDISFDASGTLKP